MAEDIVVRLRREAARFSEMDKHSERPWVADAAWASDDMNSAANYIVQLRVGLMTVIDIMKNAIEDLDNGEYEHVVMDALSSAVDLGQSALKDENNGR